MEKLTGKSVALKVESPRCLCIWAVKRNFLPGNPLRGLAKLDVTPQTPHRAFTGTEVAMLLESVPAKRRLWYETGLESGFRVNELRHVYVKDLDVFGPTLHLAAEYSKDRKEHVQPITRELADKLAELAKSRDKNEPLLLIPK